MGITEDLAYVNVGLASLFIFVTVWMVFRFNHAISLRDNFPYYHSSMVRIANDKYLRQNK